MINDDFLGDRLRDRSEKGTLRHLPKANTGEDFVSNDYLGLAINADLAMVIDDRWRSLSNRLLGGTGSRLLSGNHVLYEELEELLVKVFQSEAVLVFNSGYQANQALVASVAGKGDRILYDELSHVCLKEGAWLSQADAFLFRHNNIQDLKQRLEQGEYERTFVLTESLFSMDGDFAPISEILDLCDRYQAYLIVDEAHATGAYGAKGGGWLVEQGLANRVFARIYTFGKAMGAHGACVAGSQVLVDYLTNFARSFIYTTAMPPHSILTLIESFRYLELHRHLQQNLQRAISMYCQCVEHELGIVASSHSAIQPVWVPGSEAAMQVSNHLKRQGFNVLAIRPPTVKKGSERLRISLHTFNSEESIQKLVGCMKEVLKLPDLQ